jgi:hypothetical protein
MTALTTVWPQSGDTAADVARATVVLPVTPQRPGGSVHRKSQFPPANLDSTTTKPAA